MKWEGLLRVVGEVLIHFADCENAQVKGKAFPHRGGGPEGCQHVGVLHDDDTVCKWQKGNHARQTTSRDSRGWCSGPCALVSLVDEKDVHDRRI